MRALEVISCAVDPTTDERPESSMKRSVCVAMFLLGQVAPVALAQAESHPVPRFTIQTVAGTA